MWDFEHPPRNAALADHYELHYTRPSQCAAELLAGRADLGLIPIAALTSDLAIVPRLTARLPMQLAGGWEVGMLVFMAVLVGLYFVGVGVSWVVVRRRERRLAAAEAH